MEEFIVFLMKPRGISSGKPSWHRTVHFGSKCQFGGFIFVLIMKSIFNNKMIIKNINKNC